MPTATTPLTESLPDDSIQKLSRKTVFFGHQSVGYNILDGLRDLAAEDSRLILNIRETTDLSNVTAPTFAHSRIGRNGQPLSKVEDFSALFRKSGNARVDIALMKFCYTDFNEISGVPSAFRSYAETLAALRQSSPGTQFVHVTVPLTAPVNPLTLSLKNLIKRAIGRPANESKKAITDFNELMRKTYLGKEPVFDLAAIESTRADGTRVVTRVAGRNVYSLAPEYTSDGAHLNEKGRRIIALELLRLLAALPEKAPLK